MRDILSETVNDENFYKTNRAIERAGQPGNEIAALAALDRIPGIGLAAATAILTVCYPNDFTILDRRVLKELDLFPTRLAMAQSVHSTDLWNPKDYVDEYLPKVQECRKSWDCTLPNADRALWGLSVSKRVDELFEKGKPK